MHKIGFCFCFFLGVMVFVLPQPVLAENGEIAPNDKIIAVPIKLNDERRTLVKSPVPVRIKTAIDGTTLLAEDGKIYALTGLDMTFDKGGDAPDDDKTFTRLSTLVNGKKCTLYQTRNQKAGRINRLNHIMGHFTCGDEDAWIQGVLVNEGLARVRTTPDNNQLAKDLLTLETKARAGKKGLWARSTNTVLTPDTAKTALNRFGIVEGKVLKTAQTKDAIFLNFGTDWKTDFTVGIPTSLRRDLAKNNLSPLALRGQIIRVRGWIRDYNGPYIELDHSAGLETLSLPSQTPSISAPESPPATIPAPQEPETPTITKPVTQSPKMHTIK